jgi:predicted nuclease of predicted toxin-antitoxin system
VRLLLDENLSPKLVRYVAPAFPGSLHVRDVQLDARQDLTIWQWARVNDFTILTQDDDFFLLAQLRGQPPKVVCLRFGNRGVRDIAEQLQHQHLLIAEFISKSEAPCLELYWGPFLH